MSEGQGDIVVTFTDLDSGLYIEMLSNARGIEIFAVNADGDDSVLAITPDHEQITDAGNAAARELVAIAARTGREHGVDA